MTFGPLVSFDIRFGLMNYCPLDFDTENAPNRIRIGIVGSPASIEGVRDWLDKCRSEVPPKESRQPNLFPKFPGFNSDCGFHAELFVDSSLERQIHSNDITAITKLALRDEQKIKAVDAITEQVRSLLEKGLPK